MASNNSTISSDLERLSYGGPSGCIATGAHREVISGVGATRTLVPEESGALCLMDRAAGVVYTLPTPQVGMEFKFLATVAVTSNAYKVVTAAVASQFLVGAVYSAALAATVDVFQADGTTIASISENGSTTGGLIGDTFTVTAISATQWAISGEQVSSGTALTPFATT
jgi:hypothetical protein